MYYYIATTLTTYTIPLMCYYYVGTGPPQIRYQENYGSCSLTFLDDCILENCIHTFVSVSFTFCRVITMFCKKGEQPTYMCICITYVYVLSYIRYVLCDRCTRIHLFTFCKRLLTYSFLRFVKYLLRFVRQVKRQYFSTFCKSLL